MIESELGLYALGRGLEVFHCHDAGTVYEDIDLVDPGSDCCCCTADGGLVCKVKLDESYLDARVDLLNLLENRGGFGLRAPGQDDLCWVGASE